jgi:hypothetical protein
MSGGRGEWRGSSSNADLEVALIQLNRALATLPEDARLDVNTAKLGKRRIELLIEVEGRLIEAGTEG